MSRFIRIVWPYSRERPFDWRTTKGARLGHSLVESARYTQDYRFASAGLDVASCSGRCASSSELSGALFLAPGYCQRFKNCFSNVIVNPWMSTGSWARYIQCFYLKSISELNHQSCRFFRIDQGNIN